MAAQHVTCCDMPHVYRFVFLCSHMPPELLDGSDPDDLGFAVDIFSLGTLCWEASGYECIGQP